MDEINVCPYALNEQEIRAVFEMALALEQSKTQPCGCYELYSRVSPLHGWLIKERRPCEQHQRTN